MTSLQYLLNFAPTLDNLKGFQWTQNSGILQYTDQLQYWNFLQKIYRRIDWITVFVKAALDITIRA